MRCHYSANDKKDGENVVFMMQNSRSTDKINLTSSKVLKEHFKHFAGDKRSWLTFIIKHTYEK